MKQKSTIYRGIPDKVGVEDMSTFWRGEGSAGEKRGKGERLKGKK